MQVNETLNAGLKRGYTITVTATELDAKVTAKLEEAAPEVEMKGFRKGKVPMALLRKQFGQRILGEAMQEAIDSAMRDHLAATGDRPAMQPKVEMVDGDSWKEGQDFTVSVSYETLPVIPAVALDGITLDRVVVKADDASIAEAMDNLAKTAQIFEDRKKGAKAKDGDQVVIDFKGSVDGEAFEGGAAEDYPLVLGSNSFIPGFEAQLVGAKAGDEVSVNVSFPENYGAQHLAGKAAVFACTVKAVRAPKLAEIDDELAKRYGAEDLAGLRAQIAERLEAEYSTASRAILKRSLLDQLDALVTFDLPESLVEAEAAQIAHTLWHEEHPDDHGHHHDAVEPTDEHKSLAERRVRLGLLLAELGRAEKIEVTDAEMTQGVLAQARQYPGQERAFFEYVQKNPQVQQQIRAPLFEDKVVDFIVAGAKVSDKPLTKAELEKAIEALDDL